MGKTTSDFKSKKALDDEYFEGRLKYVKNILTHTKKILKRGDQDDEILNNAYANVNICEQNIDALIQEFNKHKK